MIAQLTGIAEVGHFPAVKVVFGHAVLGKALEAVGIAGCLRAEQAVAADFFGRTAIVDLVKFVTTAEFAADTVNSLSSLTRSSAL